MIGRKKGDDYTELPYLEGWSPLPERQWALAYIARDGTEDYHGFVAEFKARHPKIHAGPVDGWLPPSVDEYVRCNEYGVRQDIDWELASIPLTDEEREERKRKRSDVVRKRREAALAARGKLPKAPEPETPTPPKKGMSPEARAKAAERMRQMQAARKAEKAAAEAAEVPSPMP